MIKRLSPFSSQLPASPPCQGSLSTLLAPTAAGFPLTHAMGPSLVLQQICLVHECAPSPLSLPLIPSPPQLAPHAQLGQVPTTVRMLFAGAAEGCPHMRLLGSNPNWVVSQKEREGSWAGKGQGSPGSPGWQLGTPLLWVRGRSGAVSLSTGYRGSQDIELSCDALYRRMKVSEAYGDDVPPPGPAARSGDSWAKAANATRLFFPSGEAGSAASQHPE